GGWSHLGYSAVHAQHRLIREPATAAYQQERSMFMQDIAYYNGQIGRIDEVKAPITDRGLYFGDGVYDAAMVRNKKIFALSDHLDRFYSSLALLRIEPPMERDALEAVLNDLVGRLDSDAPHMLYWQSTRAAAH